MKRDDSKVFGMRYRREDEEVVEGELRALRERRSTMSGNFATLVDQVKRTFQFWAVFCIPDPALSQTEVGPDNVINRTVLYYLGCHWLCYMRLLLYVIRQLYKPVHVRRRQKRDNPMSSCIQFPDT